MTDTTPPTHHYEDLPYLRISEIPAEHRAPFKEWMRGQTCPLVPGLDPQDAVYPWDYEAFLRDRAGKPVLWD